MTIAENMTPLDSAFLRLEDRHTSLHIASVAIFDGPAPAYDEIVDLFASKLPLLPRYRQKVHEATLWVGAPTWVDDPSFALRDHLRHTALPRPGGAAQLHELVGRLMAQHLDRSRPLWECWLVEGLSEGRWALINKVHHCMVDGIAGTDLLTTVLAGSPDVGVRRIDDWEPRVRAGWLARLRTTLVAVPVVSARALRQSAGSLRRPRAVLTSAVVQVRGLVGFAELARPAAASSLSGPLGSPRCWGRASVRLDDVRAVRHALGGTVNDVVLAAVTRGFRDLLLSRGEQPQARTVRTLVPVSVRTDDQRGQIDNRITAMVAELPVHLADPVERLSAVRAELDRLKRSGEPQAGVFVTELAKFVPPILLNAGLAGLFRVPQRFVVTVATNVPGPSTLLYAVGRRLRELYPYVPIADRVRIGVAITSYDGVLYFGVTGDLDSSPDIAVLTAGIRAEVQELIETSARLTARSR
ncbi:MAG: wax ester/triacylglycerol synthase family O-acyltransferase [Jatrophihabitantaceae bacterium]